IVIVDYKSQFYRGRVERLHVKENCQVADVFFLDYGIKHTVNCDFLYNIEPGKWTSVPYQAKCIKLFAVSPVSLAYSLEETELKVVPRKTKEWDVAATEFVRALFHQQHEVEFLRVVEGNDGSLHGLVLVLMKEREWKSLIQLFPNLLPKLLAIASCRTTDAEYSWYLKEDLSRILIHLRFAVYEKELLLNYSRYLSGDTVNTVTSKAKSSFKKVSERNSMTMKVSHCSSGSENMNLKCISKELRRPDEHMLDSSKNSACCAEMQKDDNLIPMPSNKLSVITGVENSRPEQQCFLGNSERHLYASTRGFNIHVDNGTYDLTSPGSENKAYCNEEKKRNLALQVKSSKSIPVNIANYPEISVSPASSPCDVLQTCHVDSLKGSSQRSFEYQYASALDNNSYNDTYLLDESSVSSRRFSSLRGLRLVPSLQQLTNSSNCRSLRHLMSSPHVNDGFDGRDDKDLQEFQKLYSGNPENVSECSVHIEKMINNLSNETCFNSLKSCDNAVTSLQNLENDLPSFCVTLHSQDLETPAIRCVPQGVCKEQMQSLQNLIKADSDDINIANILCSTESLYLNQEDTKNEICAEESSERENCSHGLISSIPECENLPNNKMPYNDTISYKKKSGKSSDKEQRKKVVKVKYENSRDICEESIEYLHTKQGDIPFKVSESLMSDSRDIWTNEKSSELVKDEFSSGLRKSISDEGLNIAKVFRVYVAGNAIPDENVIVNEQVLGTLLNKHVTQILKSTGMSATRLQSYAWPSICQGDFSVIVGDRYTGKTMGYVVPLISTILDHWQEISANRLDGIGAVMVVVCNDWRRAECAAGYINGLLQKASISLKVVAAWGGCGQEESIAVKKLVLKGCDILITTPPCLIWLLTGKEKGQKCISYQEVPTTSLSRCCYLVIDDADLVFSNFAEDTKQLLSFWDEKQQDGDQQLVLASSTWTSALKSFVKKNSDSINRVIISSPIQAAICAGVKTHIHYVSKKDEILSKIIELLQDNPAHKKTIVFIRDDKEARILNVVLRNLCINSIYLSSYASLWEVKSLVNQWHGSSGVTMIVSEKCEYLLLQSNLANADLIFHVSIPHTLSRFMIRYAFMLENFSKDILCLDSSCESHVFLTETVVLSNPDILIELYRLPTAFPKPLVTLMLQSKEKIHKERGLCYYIKAYSNCPEKHHCKFRHKINIGDMPKHLPRSGEITFTVVKVLNASRYLIRLQTYFDKSKLTKIGFEDCYLNLFFALQKYYGCVANQLSLDYADMGMLCIVKDKDIWARGKVENVFIKGNITKLTIFLIDNGYEVTVDLKGAYHLHPQFSEVPGFIVEAYLCCIKPVDQATEWTFHASRYISDIFMNRTESVNFVGRIVLALGKTLWLSPIEERQNIGRYSFTDEPLRMKLISLGYGESNSRHIDVLIEKCIKAGITLSDELHDDNWVIEWNEMKMSLDSTFFRSLSDPTENNTSAEKQESVNGSVSCSMKTNGSCNDVAGNSTSSKTSASGTVMYKDMIAVEELPNNNDTQVKIAYIKSYDLFYVQRKDKLERLYELEDDIEQLTDSWKNSSEDHSYSLHGAICLAKFTDDSSSKFSISLHVVCKHMKISSQKKLAVYNWFVQQKVCGINVPASAIRNVYLCKHLGIPCIASDGWLWCFRNYPGLRKLSMCTGSADTASNDSFRVTGSPDQPTSDSSRPQEKPLYSPSMLCSVSLELESSDDSE
ncbi:hypothetical protein SK128_022195, partial [Halocaridina rubra]